MFGFGAPWTLVLAVPIVGPLGFGLAQAAAALLVTDVLESKSAVTSLSGQNMSLRTFVRIHPSGSPRLVKCTQTSRSDASSLRVYVGRRSWSRSRCEPCLLAFGTCSFKQAWKMACRRCRTACREPRVHARE
jgi:hypothetical protein